MSSPSGSPEARSLPVCHTLHPQSLSFSFAPKWPFTGLCPVLHLWLSQSSSVLLSWVTYQHQIAPDILHAICTPFPSYLLLGLLHVNMFSKIHISFCGTKSRLFLNPLIVCHCPLEPLVLTTSLHISPCPLLRCCRFSLPSGVFLTLETTRQSPKHFSFISQRVLIHPFP